MRRRWADNGRRLSHSDHSEIQRLISAGKSYATAAAAGEEGAEIGDGQAFKIGNRSGSTQMAGKEGGELAEIAGIGLQGLR